VPYCINCAERIYAAHCKQAIYAFSHFTLDPWLISWRTRCRLEMKVDPGNGTSIPGWNEVFWCHKCEGDVNWECLASNTRHQLFSENLMSLHTKAQKNRPRKIKRLD
jgi:hypothetical protein